MFSQDCRWRWICVEYFCCRWHKSPFNYQCDLSMSCSTYWLTRLRNLRTVLKLNTNRNITCRIMYDRSSLGHYAVKVRWKFRLYVLYHFCWRFLWTYTRTNVLPFGEILAAIQELFRGLVWSLKVLFPWVVNTASGSIRCEVPQNQARRGLLPSWDSEDVEHTPAYVSMTLSCHEL